MTAKDGIRRRNHQGAAGSFTSCDHRKDDLFEGELTDNDMLALAKRVGGKMMENEMLAEQAAVNTKEQFGSSPRYAALMLDSVADGPDKYQQMAKQVLNSKRVQDGLSEISLDLLFAGFAKQHGEDQVAI